MSWVQFVLGIVVAWLFLTYIAIPWCAQLLSSFRLRATKLSPLTSAGIEWRSKHHASDPHPTLRIERIYWSWGGCGDSNLALNIEGVTFRVRSKRAENGEAPPAVPKKKMQLPDRVKRSLNYLSHWLFHYWSSVASFFSIRVSGVRIIFEDLQGVEVSVQEVRLGVHRDSSTPIPTCRPLQPDEYHDRLAENGVHPSLHQRASSLSSRVSRKASIFLSHAIGATIDRVAFTAKVSNVAVLLPQALAIPTATPALPHLSPKPSMSSLRPKAARPPSFTSFGPISSLLKLKQPDPVLHDEGGYRKLLVIEDTTAIRLSVGFGPNRPILTEDNLRTSVDVGTLHVGLDGFEKLQKVVKSRPRPLKRAASGGSNMAKLLGRAFESGSIAIPKMFVSHLLPAAGRPPSTRSSVTDLSVTTDDAEPQPLSHTLSLDFTDLTLKLACTNSSEDSRLIKVFGNNTSSECLVRGITANLQWTSIELQCIAPGETSNDKVQLVAIRQAEMDMLTTWRPDGWEQPHLLFRNDPNQALLIARGYVASVDVAGDIQLVDELKQAWDKSRPPKEPYVEALEPVRFTLPPQVRFVLDIGPTSIVVANRASHENATITLASDGLSVGAHSHFSDLVLSTSDKLPSPLSSLSTMDKDDASVASDAPTRATFNSDETKLDEPPAKRPPEDFALSMHTEAFVTVEPILLRLSIGSRNENMYRLLSIGRMETKASGDVYAARTIHADGRESHHLSPQTLSSDFEMCIDNGIQVELWDKSVIDNLVQLAAMKDPSPSKPPRNIFDRLPGGVAARLSLGVVSVFIGSEDRNPHCNLRLSHGLWLQTTCVLEYARYHGSRLRDSLRHLKAVHLRRELKLFDDVGATAFQTAQKLAEKDGDAALFAVLLRDTRVRSVFNGKQFVACGGVDQAMPEEDLAMPPQPEQNLEFAAWGFSGDKRRERPRMPSPGMIVHLPEGNMAPRSLFRMPYILVTGRVHRTTPEAPSEINISSRIQLVDVVGFLSDVYCAFLAVQALRRISKALKKSVEPMRLGPKRTSHVQIAVLVPAVWIKWTFPLKKSLFLSMAGVKINKSPDKLFQMTADHVLAHVVSAAMPGYWDELGRIKKLSVSMDKSRAIVTSAAVFRIRIPHAYVMSQLILNINVTIKSAKLLFSNISSVKFETIKRPISEGPKRVPRMMIHVDLLHVEARDHPVENRMNLANRAGLIEQRQRIALEDMFEHKMNLLSDVDMQPVNNLTTNQTVSVDEARWRLDWYISRAWVKRIKRAKEEQRRRESAVQATMKVKLDHKLPIWTLPLEQTAPLFRAAFSSVDLSISKPSLNRKELIQYMSDVSAPFKEDAEFSLWVPFDLDWAMGEAKVTLRDYPLPLLRIQPAKSGPAWRVTTLFIIAEELAPVEEDSCVYVPIEVLPAQCGHADAKPLLVQIAKTIMPPKTYARPMIKIMTDGPTSITWCNSYSPGIQDFQRVMDTLSHPPRDPSAKPGFWDKFRLTLHWCVTMDFKNIVRLYLKGSQDPYAITGTGAGFALVFRNNVHWEICQPNVQHETVQIMADELLITIPDLTGLHDAAAVGTEVEEPLDPTHADRILIERRSAKPCARFLNGIRFGVGFRFERTCRAWNCQKGCGDTDNLLHRQCRLFEFIPHQAVILKNPEAVERLEAKAGHPVDSFEGFRSDFIHFSLSLEAPRDRTTSAPRNVGAETHNSLHLSPKGFAHVVSWWNLFTSKASIPTRQGRVFPDSPPKSKKFGKSLGTIKYRWDLAPVYVSHVYGLVSHELWQKGQARSLGVKMRVGRLRLDGHQRMQEARDWNPELNRHKIITHKPFYAADLLLDAAVIKCIVADFDEAKVAPPNFETVTPDDVHPRASELPDDLREWFNYFDFIDADRKPFDRNPRMQIVHFGDCPHVFLSRRVKARLTMPDPDDESSSSDMEASKFGHEKSHICYLGAAQGVGPMQMQIAKERIEELQEMYRHLPRASAAERQSSGNMASTIKHRISTLQHHVDDLAHRERRRIDNNTLEAHDAPENPTNESGELSFENTLHVHCPRLFFNNKTRNILYKYLYSRNNRQKEEYFTSHASLRSIRDGINRRMQRAHNGLNRDDMSDEDDSSEFNTAVVLRESLDDRVNDKPGQRFKLAADFTGDADDIERPKLGLPSDCTANPHWRALVLKPQVALRSDADSNAVVLVAVEEISFKGFSVKDMQGLDRITMDVMSRNYITFRGLQAFYPSGEVIDRDWDVTTGRLDFVPLEIFLDVRSETTDYDRIVLKTDMSVTFDRFNHLRVARGLEWPETKNDLGEDIDHLRKHQNLTTVIIPMVTVSATSDHYTALYYIVTDLIMYRDPQQADRAEKIDSFMYKFDRRDRDPQQLLLSLFVMQQHIRSLSELQRGYESNVERLTEQGKRELFRIRADVLNEYEALYTVFEVINQSRARDDARAAMKTQARLDVRAGNIAWHMLRDSGNPLIKLNMKHTLASVENNQDGSSDNALVVGEVQALNSNADAIYPEVMSRSDKADKRKNRAAPFISASLSFLPQVGGISIIREFALYLYPLRFRLEEEVGTSILDYIFNDRTRRAKETKEKERSLLDVPIDSEQIISRSQSQVSLATRDGNRARSGTVLTADSSGKGVDLSDYDTAEMRRRALHNRTFISIVVGSTMFVLDYKRDDNKKHGTITWPEVVDFRLQVPSLEYRNKVWSFEEIFEHVKTDIKKSAWSQKGDIVSQVFKKTSAFRSKKSLRQIAGIETAELPSWPTSKKNTPKSPLRFTVHDASPLSFGDNDTTPVQRTTSRLSATERRGSRRGSAQISGTGSPSSFTTETNGDGKSRRKHRLRNILKSRNHGHDESSDSGNDEGSAEEFLVSQPPSPETYSGPLRQRTSGSLRRHADNGEGASDWQKSGWRGTSEMTPRRGGSFMSTSST